MSDENNNLISENNRSEAKQLSASKYSLVLVINYFLILLSLITSFVMLAVAYGPLWVGPDWEWSIESSEITNISVLFFILIIITFIANQMIIIPRLCSLVSDKQTVFLNISSLALMLLMILLPLFLAPLFSNTASFLIWFLSEVSVVILSIVNYQVFNRIFDSDSNSN
jgi:hypothetical protein